MPIAQRPNPVIVVLQTLQRILLITPLFAALIACPSSDDSSVPGASATSSEPGRYFMFRTLDTGNAPTAEQTARCHEHLGPVESAAIITELDAELYSVAVDPQTARVVNEQAQKIGVGYICGAAPLNDPTVGLAFDAYAYATIAGFPELELQGPCSLQPVVAQPGALLLNCRLEIIAAPEHGIAGGSATSNSTINPVGVPGNPTGSVWTAYVIETSP